MRVPSAHGEWPHGRLGAPTEVHAPPPARAAVHAAQGMRRAQLGKRLPELVQVGPAEDVVVPGGELGGVRPGAVPPVNAGAFQRQPRARAVENRRRRAHHPIAVRHQLARVPPEEEPPVVAVPPPVRPRSPRVLPADLAKVVQRSGASRKRGHRRP